MASNEDYKNITLYGPTQKQVVSYLEANHQISFVSPTVNGYTDVYAKDVDIHGVEELMRLAQVYSAALECAALGIGYFHEALLWFHLYKNGDLIDEYDSFPNYTGPNFPDDNPRGGDTKKICEMFGVEQRVDAVQGILHDNTYKGKRFSSERERHMAFAEDLGMPVLRTCLYYAALRHREFERLGLPQDFSISDFIHTGGTRPIDKAKF